MLTSLIGFILLNLKWSWSLSKKGEKCMQKYVDKEDFIDRFNRLEDKIMGYQEMMETRMADLSKRIDTLMERRSSSREK